MDDGTLIDTKGWEHPTVFSWEWTHGIALTALCHVRLFFAHKTNLSNRIAPSHSLSLSTLPSRPPPPPPKNP